MSAAIESTVSLFTEVLSVGQYHQYKAAAVCVLSLDFTVNHLLIKNQFIVNL